MVYYANDNPTDEGFDEIAFRKLAIELSNEAFENFMKAVHKDD